MILSHTCRRLDGMEEMVALHMQLFFNSRAHKRFINKSMIDYCEQSSYCRRDILFCDFDMYQHADCNVGCMYCDVCRQICNCRDCIIK